MESVSSGLLSLKSIMEKMNESLNCAICKEIFTTPVLITVCSHNFCSICIRRYFIIRQECPICGMEASSVHLVPNRIIETLSKQFISQKNLIDKLLRNSYSDTDVNFLKTSDGDVTSSSRAANHVNADVVDITTESAHNSHAQKQREILQLPCSSKEQSFELDPTPRFSLGLKDFCTQSQDLSSESFNTDDNNASRTADCLPNGSVTVRDEPLQEPASEAVCPVCGMPVATVAINSHLDTCLAREEKKSALRQNTPKRLQRNNPPTAKLAYSLLSIRDLRRKMKEIGLPTNGDKADLKRRHQEFLIKYQAEMDSASPRHVNLIIEELRRDEEQRKQMETKASFVSKFSPTKSTDVSVENEAHVQRNAKQYKKLEELASKSLPRKRRRISTERKLFDEPTENKSEAAPTTVDDGGGDGSVHSNSDGVVPDSEPFPPSSNDGFLKPTSIYNNCVDSDPMDGGGSPELYADAPTTSGLYSPSNRVDLRAAVESDSQADEIKDFIDASLSEAY